MSVNEGSGTDWVAVYSEEDGNITSRPVAAWFTDGEKTFGLVPGNDPHLTPAGDIPGFIAYLPGEIAKDTQLMRQLVQQTISGR